MKLSDTVKKMYHGTPEPVQFIFWPLRFMDRFIYRSLNRIRYDLWILYGEEAGSKEKISIIYAGIAGRIENKNFLIKLSFNNSCREEYLGKTWLWNVSSMMKKKGSHCSIMCTEVQKSYRRFYRKTSSFYVPCWIEGAIDISFDSPSEIKESLNKNRTLKDDLRKIRKHRLSFEITNELSLLHDFYYRMHLPYISQSHNDTVVINDYELIRKEFRKSDLLLIRNGEEHIAGVMIKYEKRGPRLRIAGVKDANRKYIHCGAVGAIYYYSVNYLKEKGFEKLNLGLSRAFLKDGVLRFKKKWGLAVIDEDKSGFVLQPLKDSAGSRGFFHNNPFVFVSKDRKFHSAVLIHAKERLTAPDFERIFKDYYLPGVSQLNIYLDGGIVSQDLLKSIPIELRDRLKIYPAENLFQGV